MSHLIVEIPKILPLIGKWLYVAAENWIQEDILFLPNDSYVGIVKQLRHVVCAVRRDFSPVLPLFVCPALKSSCQL